MLYKRIFIFFLFLSLGLGSYAQDRDYIEVVGRVMTQDNGGQLDGARMIVEKNGESPETITLPRSGRFNLELEFQNDYKLTFECDGFFKKIIEVSTRVPLDVLEEDSYFPELQWTVQLYENILGIDATFTESPVARVFYSSDINNFDTDIYYSDIELTQRIQEFLLQNSELADEQDAIDRADERELADRERQYDNIINNADALYQRQNLDEALVQYQAARDLFPDRPYPNDRIAELQDLIAAIALAQQREQDRETGYQTAIDQGDNLFDESRFDEAAQAYQQALEYKEDDDYATGRLEESNQRYEQQQIDNQFNDLITQADDAFGNQNYEDARSLYQQAIELKPDDAQYPNDQLARIDEEIARQEQLALEEQQYNEAIVNATEALQDQEYQDAIDYFDEALAIREGDPFAQEQKQNAEQLLVQQENLASYNDLIDDADRQFRRENWNDAKDLYNQALSYMPEEEYPVTQIAEIDNTLAQQAIQQQYDEIIATADRAFDQQEYDQAIQAYTQALELKPDESYPSSQIVLVEEEVNRLEELAQQTEEDYQQALLSGNNFLESQSFDDARESFQEAKELKPEETLPDELIARADSMEQVLAEELARQEALRQEMEQQYADAIEEADRLFNNNELEDAKTSYQAASSIKPEEDYPKQQITLIDAEIARLAELNNAYNQAVEEADQLAGNEMYTQAKDKYEEALQYLPDEEYPKMQILRMDEILAQIEAERQQDLAYQASIQTADSLFNLESYEPAKDEYLAASDIKPDESYPKDKVNEIDGILAAIQEELQRQQLIDQQYSEAISLADQAFDDEEYPQARSSYQEALSIKPSESYPQDQLNEISRLEALALEQAYQAAIDEADRLYNQDQLDPAKSSYQDALEIKAGDEYATGQIELINEQLAQLAQQEELESQYQSIITQADNAFNSEQYPDSKGFYQQALEVKPGEEYPTQRIARIDQILEEIQNQQALDDQYNSVMANAEDAYSQDQLQDAIGLFQQALTLKPDETLPGERITEIQAIIDRREEIAQLAAEEEAQRLAAEQAKRQQYDDAIANGDAQFENETYASAIDYYNEAISIFPDEQYPKDQIDEIERIIDEQTQAQLALRQQAYEDSLARAQLEAYNIKINQAEQYVANEQLQNAITAYSEAIQILPDREGEIQPIIVDLQNQLRTMADLEENYQNAIVSGDQAFDADQLTNAKTQYQFALSLKPDEEYPASRINQIDSMLAERADQAARQQEIDDRYQEAIQLADNSFDQENYNVSRNQYTAALDIKPQETYPLAQIDRIDQILNSLEQEQVAIAEVEESPEAPVESTIEEQAAPATIVVTNEDYNDFVSQADNYFNQKDYPVAQFYYYKAVDAKPGDTYSLEKIDEISSLMDQTMLASQLTAYDEAISKADEEFNNENYIFAKFYYNQALGIKSWEQYPKDQIEEIRVLTNSLLSQREEEEYKNLIASGDEAFFEKNYAIARAYYQQALTIGVDEEYPQMKIDDIENAIISEKEAQRDEEYQQSITQADDAWMSENYAVSRYYYNQALSIKPDEAYPREQLQKIRDALSGNSE